MPTNVAAHNSKVNCHLRITWKFGIKSEEGVFCLRLLCFQRRIQTLELHTIKKMSSAWLKTGQPDWSWSNGTQTSFGIPQHCPTCPRLERRSSERRHCSGDMTLKKSWLERRSSELACWRGKPFQTLWIRCALSLTYFLYPNFSVAI